MAENTVYDMVIMGNYTKDTIVSQSGTRLVDGGGFNYGTHVGRMMGLKVAAVTRLAEEDKHVVKGLEEIGADVFAVTTPHSTQLRLFYPTDNVDDRILTATTTAGCFTVDQIEELQGKTFLINASTRGEIPLPVIEAIKKKNTRLSIDAQGFVRVIDPEGVLRYESWPERDEILALVDVLKADSREVEILTGESDMNKAARILRDLGPSEVVITRAQGILVYADDRFYDYPFYQKAVEGRSGRGDTCIASYMAKRLSSSPAEATRWAAAVTSLKMEKEGPIKRELREVEEYLAKRYKNRYFEKDRN